MSSSDADPNRPRPIPEPSPTHPRPVPEPSPNRLRTVPESFPNRPRTVPEPSPNRSRSSPSLGRGVDKLVEVHGDSPAGAWLLRGERVEGTLGAKEEKSHGDVLIEGE